MNFLKNDLGEVVTVIGAPCSFERVKIEYPGLIEELSSIEDVDEATAIIKKRGIVGRICVQNILRAAQSYK